MAKVDVVSVFKDSNKLSKDILKVKKNVSSLTKELNEFSNITEKAFNKRREVKIKINKAQRELKKLEQAYKNGDKTAEKSYKNKKKYVGLLKKEYGSLGNVIENSNNAQKTLAENLSRNSNKPNLKGAKGTLKSIAQSDLGGMVANSLGGLGNQLVSSAFGSSVGDTVGSVVGGAAKGAAIGSVIPGVGTVIGGAIGALTGAIDSFTKSLEKKDDIFRGEVQSIQEKVAQEQQENHQEGIETFMARERDSLGQSAQQICDLLSDGVMSLDDVKQTFEDSNLGDFNSSMSELMQTYTGKEAVVNNLKKDINSSYGEGFAEASNPALDLEIEKLSGKTGEEMKFLQQVEGMHDAQLKSGESETKIGAYEDLFEHNPKYRVLKQIIKNPEQYSEKDVEGAVEQVHQLIQETDVKGKTNWLTSDENQADIKQEMELTESIQKALALSEDYIELLMEKADKESLGFLGGKRLLLEEEQEEADEATKVRKERLHSYWETRPFWERLVFIDPTDEELDEFEASKATPTGNGHATGLHRVPFDNMPTLLHEGERVLTRLQADEMDRQRNAPPPNINLQVNANTSDPYQLARILYSELKNAMENYNGGV